ncbi:MAG: glutamyl-tRNA reductase [Candidatus Limivivens sp.]|nr:glutamyl-tRNA reductase [Candidatus Limivivens sp.]
MAIQMIGIDHKNAGIDVRTVFSFTKKKIAEALEILKGIRGISGCVLLSTCNRFELWTSTTEEFQGDLYEILCDIRELKGEYRQEYRSFFTERREREAVSHLFTLACGLESRILGEDQIITQVKDALTMAREQYATDNVLEILFRIAVTAAKKVKTEVILTDANQSVIHQALATLGKEGYTVHGKNCMVIGNGAMGKLAATVLTQAGADVTVTVRQYRSGIVDIPKGCKRIDYGERLSLFPKCDLVVSATASPNFTLREEQIRELSLERPMILLDLAVPRDIDPGIAGLERIRLYDIDYFQVDVQSEKLKQNIEKARAILDEQMEEFYVWYECRDIIPQIQDIKEKAVHDCDLRLSRVLRDLPMAEEEREKLAKSIDTAVAKVVNKMMFGLRDNVSKQTLRECVEGLEKVYEE